MIDPKTINVGTASVILQGLLNIICAVSMIHVIASMLIALFFNAFPSFYCYLINFPL
nr:MAG TPA: hypothetical protein [Caudoviricetes sp.]